MLTKFFAIVRVGGIERGGWVVARYTVFGDQRCYVGIRIFVEEAVVPHTQADDYVQIGLGFVQQACLQDGVTHGCTDAFALLRDAD